MYLFIIFSSWSSLFFLAVPLLLLTFVLLFFIPPLLLFPKLVRAQPPAYSAAPKMKKSLVWSVRESVKDFFFLEKKRV